MCVIFAKDLEDISISSLVLRPKAKSGRLRASNKSSRQMQEELDEGLVCISFFHKCKIPERLLLPCVLPGLIVRLVLSCSDSVFSHGAMIIWD